MIVSLTLPQFREDPDALLAAAGDVERLGYHGAFVFDHLYPLSGRRRPILDVVPAIGALVAATQTLRIGTLVLRAPIRPASITRRICVTAQELSQGRFVCGIGAADSLSRGEFEAYGVPFGSAADRVAAVAEVLNGIAPVWVGGRSERIQRLAWSRADGWNVWEVSPEWIEARLDRVEARGEFTVSWGGQVLIAPDARSLDAAVGRRRSQPAIAGTPETVRSRLGELEEAGVDEFVLTILDTPWDGRRLFAEAVLSVS